ncbi:hypothetical protein KY335_03340 [Candidatus Woesearchaeota archaeon]|nr:hypothetical protein [Candidatus Woesearchaeota archaeon]
MKLYETYQTVKDYASLARDFVSLRPRLGTPRFLMTAGACLLGAALLYGCAKEPTPEEVAQAVQQDVERNNKEVKTLTDQIDETMKALEEATEAEREWQREFAKAKAEDEMTDEAILRGYGLSSKEGNDGWKPDNEQKKAAFERWLKERSTDKKE